MYVHSMYAVPKVVRRWHPNPLKLQLQIAENHQMDVGTESISSARAPSALNIWDICPASSSPWLWTSFSWDEVGKTMLIEKG